MGRYFLMNKHMKFYHYSTEPLKLDLDWDYSTKRPGLGKPKGLAGAGAGAGAYESTKTFLALAFLSTFSHRSAIDRASLPHRCT